MQYCQVYDISFYSLFLMFLDVNGLGYNDEFKKNHRSSIAFLSRNNIN